MLGGVTQQVSAMCELSMLIKQQFYMFSFIGDDDVKDGIWQ